MTKKKKVMDEWRLWTNLSLSNNSSVKASQQQYLLPWSLQLDWQSVHPQVYHLFPKFRHSHTGKLEVKQKNSKILSRRHNNNEPAGGNLIRMTKHYKITITYLTGQVWFGVRVDGGRSWGNKARFLFPSLSFLWVLINPLVQPFTTIKIKDGSHNFHQKSTEHSLLAKSQLLCRPSHSKLPMIGFY